jgi:O-antigen ligase
MEILAVIVIGGVVLFLVWRMVRFVFRLVLLGVLLLLLLVGAYAWLYGFGKDSSARPKNNSPVRQESVR